MYTCDGCGYTGKPRESRVGRISMVRKVNYKNTLTDSVSTGFETVKEIDLCPTCNENFKNPVCINESNPKVVTIGTGLDKDSHYKRVAKRIFR
jgi:hypothetical protein